MQLLKLPDVFLSPRVPVEVVGASSPGQGTWEPCGTAPTHILFGNVLLNVPVQDSLFFSAAIPPLFSYSTEPERPCVPLLPAAHLFQASERAVPSQAVIPKPNHLSQSPSFPGQVCGAASPAIADGAVGAALTISSSSSPQLLLKSSPHVLLTPVQPSLLTHRAPVQLALGCILHTLFWD